jgi:hypothetical protein
MTTTPAHDWLRPRLARLLADARTAGIPYDVAVAVLIDLATSETFNPPGSDKAGDFTP